MLKDIYNKHRETIFNFIWRSVQVVGDQGITLVIFVFSAYFLSPYEFGIYNYVLAIVFFLIIFGDFGISTATSKYVAEYKINNEDYLKSRLYNSGLIILLLTFVSLIVVVLLGPKYLGSEYHYFLYILPLIFFSPMTALYDGIYRGLERFKALMIITVIVSLFSAIAAFFLIQELGLIGSLISQNLYFILLFIALAIGYTEFNFKLNLKVMKEITSYSIIIGLGEIGFLLYLKIDTIMLGYFNYIVQIGYLEIANKIFAVLVIPFTIYGQVLSPQTVSKFVKKSTNIRKELVIRSLGILVISVTTAIVLYFLYPVLLHYSLTKYLNPASLAIFGLLLVIFPLSALASFVSQGYLYATGNARYNLLMIPFGMLNIFLNYIFIISFGYIGVVYSTIICTTLLRIIMWSLLYRKLSTI